MMPDRDIPDVTLHWAVRLGTYAFGAVAVWVGTAILLQSATRMDSPGWQAAFNLLPPAFWGAYLLTAGVVMVAAIPFGDWGRIAVGCASVAVGVALLGRTIAACWAALRDPEASGTAPALFALLTGCYLLHGLVHFRWFDHLAKRLAR